MGVAENIAAVRRFYAAGPPQDDAKRHAFATPDIVWHVPGENPVAGRYEGHAAVFGEIGQRMQPLDGRIAETWGFVDDQAELDALLSYVT
jgi:ketosteroid isomerase-like protein